MTLRTLTVNAPLLESDVLKWLVERDFCVDQEVLKAGSGADNAVEIGTVYGRIVAATVTVGTPVLTGTGNGALTKADTAYGPGVMSGAHLVRCIEKTSDSGEFEVVRPDGAVDGFAVVGTAYVGQIEFTIADSTTDFDQTSVFAVPVSISGVSSKVVPLNLSGVDGSQNAAGVSLSRRVALDGGSDQPIVGLKRGPAIVVEQRLIWPDNATAEQISAGIAQLEKLGIVVHAS